MSTNQQQSFKDLYRRVNITTDVRYGSAKRLNSHHRFSQWVVTLVSVALIVIPLCKAMKVPLRQNPQLLDAIEVLLAVVVLVYSLLLGNENYSGRAERMQSCGLDLGRLSRKIYPLIDQPHEDNLYSKLSEEYHDILERYPNHDSIDYKIYKIERRASYFSNHIFYVSSWFYTKIIYAFGYWHYLTVMFGVIITLLFVFRF
jgi:hypothetical protein